MFSPVALLTLLCCATVLLFGDRGAVSSNSITGDPDSGIRHDFRISVAESGWVYASSMVILLQLHLASRMISSKRESQVARYLSVLFQSIYILHRCRLGSPCRHQHQLILASPPMRSVSLAWGSSFPPLGASAVPLHLHSPFFSLPVSSWASDLVHLFLWRLRL